MEFGHGCGLESLAEEEGLREERKVGGQKTKKVSANNNQPGDRHGSEVGLRDRDASEATARERHARRTLHFASVAMQPATSCMSHVTSIARRRSHGVNRTNAAVRCTTINARRDDADVPTSAGVETGRSEVFLGDLGRA